VIKGVKKWRKEAEIFAISAPEQKRMARAFRMAD
jgi:hypothetical protein